MAIKLDFDTNHNPIPFSLVLCRKNLEKLGELHNVSGIKANFKGKPFELSFVFHKYMDGYEDPLWREVFDLRVIYIPEIEQYYQLEVQVTDEGSKLYKTVTATSLSASELGQIKLFDFQVNTSDDIARDDYEPAYFYDKEKPEASLLGRVFSAVPTYTIKHVDNSLCGLQRTFSVNNVSVYDFLNTTVAQECNCYFEFNDADRSVSVYDLYTVCQNDECNFYIEHGYRYRAEFNDVCPKCGSHNVTHFGTDTSIYVDSSNLTENIQFTTDVGSIKNTFKLIGGDDLMTSTIRSINPNGSDRIYYFSEETKKDMPPELVEKIEAYDADWNKQQPIYSSIMQKYYEALDEKHKLEEYMMPVPEKDKAGTSAAKEISQLTSANLSPLGISSLTDKTSATVVENAIKQYAQIYYKSRYYKITVSTASYDQSTHVWNGTITLKNAADEKDKVYYSFEDKQVKKDKVDTATTPILTINVVKESKVCLEQKANKIFADWEKTKKGLDDGTIFDVLKIKNIELFKEAVKKYSLHRLESFSSAIQNAIDVAWADDCKSSADEGYDDVVAPLLKKKKIVDDEIDIRQDAINDLQIIIDNCEEQRTAIQNNLDFKNYLGEELYNVFILYKREDQYSNSNFTSDGLVDTLTTDNAGLFKRAEEFLDYARKDIVKSGEYQHTISANLYDLFTIPEFAPLIHQFQINNWIRVGIDDEIYRLRLTGFSIDFDNPKNIDTEFSDVTKTALGYNDIQSLLSKTKQMASSYGHVEKQASKGDAANKVIDDFRKIGLDSSLYEIRNNNKEEIVIDNNGLVARSYDDITDSYKDKQFKITHNILAFTDDNWASIRTALGNFKFVDEKGIVHTDQYGLNADFVIAGLVQGSKMVAGQIYSENYAAHPNTNSHFDLNTGAFNLGGKCIVFDPETEKLTFGPNVELTFDLSSESNVEQITKITKNAINTEYLNSLHITAKDLEGDTIKGKKLVGCIFQNEAETFYVDADGNIKGATLNGGSISIGGDENQGIAPTFTVNEKGEAICHDLAFYGKLYAYDDSNKEKKQSLFDFNDGSLLMFPNTIDGKSMVDFHLTEKKSTGNDHDWRYVNFNAAVELSNGKNLLSDGLFYLGQTCDSDKFIQENPKVNPHPDRSKYYYISSAGGANLKELWINGNRVVVQDKHGNPITVDENGKESSITTSVNHGVNTESIVIEQSDSSKTVLVIGVPLKEAVPLSCDFTSLPSITGSSADLEWHIDAGGDPYIITTSYNSSTRTRSHGHVVIDADQVIVKKNRAIVTLTLHIKGDRSTSGKITLPSGRTNLYVEPLAINNSVLKEAKIVFDGTPNLNFNYKHPLELIPIKEMNGMIDNNAISVENDDICQYVEIDGKPYIKLEPNLPSDKGSRTGSYEAIIPFTDSVLYKKDFSLSYEVNARTVKDASTTAVYFSNTCFTDKNPTGTITFSFTDDSFRYKLEDGYFTNVIEKRTGATLVLTVTSIRPFADSASQTPLSYYFSSSTYYSEDGTEEHHRSGGWVTLTGWESQVTPKVIPLDKIFTYTNFDENNTIHVGQYKPGLNCRFTPFLMDNSYLNKISYSMNGSIVSSVDVVGSDPGTYAVTVSITDKVATWEDGTRDPKTFYFIIDKVDFTGKDIYDPTKSNVKRKLYKSNTKNLVTEFNDSTYGIDLSFYDNTDLGNVRNVLKTADISVEPEDSVTYEKYDLDTLRFTLINKNYQGDVNVYINIPESDKYYTTSGSRRLLATIPSNVVYKDTWSNSTDENLAAMVNSSVQLSEYWTLGDSRRCDFTIDGVTRSSRLYLLAVNHKDSTEKPCYPTEDNATPNYLVMMVISGIRCPFGTESNDWSMSQLRTFANETVYNALPESIKAVMRKIRFVTTINNNNVVTTDYFTPLSETEVFGKAVKSSKLEASENTKLDEFDFSAINWKGNETGFWLRSGDKNDTHKCCYVTPEGNCDVADVTEEKSLVLIGCI